MTKHKQFLSTAHISGSRDKASNSTVVNPMILLEKDIDDLIGSGQLTIQDDIKWKPKKGENFYEFRVKVIAPYMSSKDFQLELIGTKNKQINRYTFILALNKRRIRGLCPFERHTNRCPVREKLGSPHKHKWIDDCQDAVAYLPTDITNPADIGQTFVEFVSECGITHHGEFEQPPTTQPTLPLGD